MRNVILYNEARLFVGPSSSGFNFISYSGISGVGYLNDEFNNYLPDAVNLPLSSRGEGWPDSYFSTYLPISPNATSGPVLTDPNKHGLYRNSPLLFPVDRVQGINYSIDAQRSDLKHIGKQGTINRLTISHPVINLSFSYLLNSVKNENRVGLMTNYSQYQYPFSGDSKYASRVCLLSGFTNKSLTRPTGNPLSYPFNYRDKRNFFVAINTRDNDDIAKRPFEDFSNSDSYPEVLNNVDVIGFGNCYLNNYSVDLSVGNAPIANLTYIAENIQMTSSGSGFQSPGLDAQTRTNFNKHVNIPNTFSEGGVSVLKPGDIIATISGINNNTIGNLICNIDNIKLQNLSASMSLNREPLPAIGYFLPVDRSITFPVYIDINMGIICDAQNTGNLLNLINRDEEYQIGVKMFDNKCTDYTPHINPFNPGIPTGLNNVIIQYDFLRCKYISSSYSAAIGRFKTANFVFSTEIEQNDDSKGWFISGQLQIPKLEDFLLISHASGVVSGDKSYLLNTDNSLITNNLAVIY